MESQIYQTCPIHPREYLQVVCLECEGNAIACPLCIDLSHKNHTMVSLKKFLAEEMPKLFTKKPDYRVLEKGINEIGTSYEKLFQEMRNKISRQLNELQYNYKLEVEALKEENRVICGQGERLYTIKNVSVVKKKIQRGEKIPQKQVFLGKVSQLCEKMRVLVGEVTEDVCEIIKGMNSFWEASRELLLNSRRECRFTFSPSLKHRSLSIQVNHWQGRKVLNEIYDSNSRYQVDSYHIAVVEPPLNPFNNQIHFRVEKSTNKCVWLGVCDLEKIIERRFSNCYKRGEGGYWLWQAGGKGGAQHFSSLLEESVALPWNFSPGDIVKVRLLYEKDNRFVEFEKNGGKVFRAKMKKANVYCGCVAMGAQQESVVIVQH